MSEGKDKGKNEMRGFFAPLRMTIFFQDLGGCDECGN